MRLSRAKVRLPGAKGECTSKLRPGSDKWSLHMWEVMQTNEYRGWSW